MPSMESIPSRMLQNDKNLLQSAMDRLVDNKARMFIAMIATVLGEKQHCKVVLIEKLVEHMVQGAKRISSDEDEDEAIQKPSQTNTLYAIAVVKRCFVGKELICDFLLAVL